MRDYLSRAREILLDKGATSLIRSGFRHGRYHTNRKLERAIHPYIHWIKTIRFRHQYGRAAPARDDLIYVDPNEVEHLLTPNFWSRLSRYSTHVEGGSWDVNRSDRSVLLSGRHEGYREPKLTRFENYGLYNSCKAHFEDGVDWRRTDLYNSLIDNADKYWQAYNSKENIERTLSKLDALHSRMASEGYLSQKECRRQDRLEVNEGSGFPPTIHEVAVSIGRDGEIIFDDGRHRFVLAKILGFNEIPVRVLVRHRQWQELRAEMAQATRTEELSEREKNNREHPDIQGLFTS